MNRFTLTLTLLAALSGWGAITAAAQTIPGGTCSTADLAGQYAFVLTGRSVSAAGAFNLSYAQLLKTGQMPEARRHLEPLRILR